MQWYVLTFILWLMSNFPCLLLTVNTGNQLIPLKVNIYMNTLLHNFVMYILFCSLYISKVTDEENLFNSQELLFFVIISFILMTVMCDSGVML